MAKNLKTTKNSTASLSLSKNKEKIIAIVKTQANTTRITYTIILVSPATGMWFMSSIFYIGALIIHSELPVPPHSVRKILLPSLGMAGAVVIGSPRVISGLIELKDLFFSSSSRLKQVEKFHAHVYRGLINVTESIGEAGILARIYNALLVENLIHNPKIACPLALTLAFTGEITNRVIRNGAFPLAREMVDRYKKKRGKSPKRYNEKLSTIAAFKKHWKRIVFLGSMHGFDAVKPVGTILREFYYQTDYKNNGLEIVLNIAAFGTGAVLGVLQENARLVLSYDVMLRKQRIIEQGIDPSKIDDSTLARITREKNKGAYLSEEMVSWIFRISGSINLSIIIWDCFLGLYDALFTPWGDNDVPNWYGNLMFIPTAMIMLCYILDFTTFHHNGLDLEKEAAKITEILDEKDDEEEGRIKREIRIEKDDDHDEEPQEMLEVDDNEEDDKPLLSDNDEEDKSDSEENADSSDDGYNYYADKESPEIPIEPEEGHNCFLVSSKANETHEMKMFIDGLHSTTGDNTFDDEITVLSEEETSAGSTSTDFLPDNPVEKDPSQLLEEAFMIPRIGGEKDESLLVTSSSSEENSPQSGSPPSSWKTRLSSSVSSFFGSSRSSNSSQESLLSSDVEKTESSYVQLTDDPKPVSIVVREIVIEQSEKLDYSKYTHNNYSRLTSKRS